MASKIIVDQLEKSGLTALTLPLANATANQILKNDGAGALSWAADTGKILTVVQHELGTTISTTSTVYVATGLTITITPASSASRFILQCTGGQAWTATPPGGYITSTFYVNGVEITPNGPYGVIKQCNAIVPEIRASHSMMTTHSPGGVSAQTYTVHYKTNAGTSYFNESACRVQLTVTELNS